ncbi:MAG: hypothetical protein HC887_01450 [Desulfobacteraceae bacterium]|nr:hypothetical protein [Desulfobacteraceae bacterium]
MMTRTVILLLFALIFSSMPAAAEEDQDLDMIPDTVMSAPTRNTIKPLAEPEKSYRFKIFADEALQGNFKRDDLKVPLPSDNYTSRNNRVSLDLRAEVRLCPGISAIIADRVNHFFR